MKRKLLTCFAIFFVLGCNFFSEIINNKTEPSKKNSAPADDIAASRNMITALNDLPQISSENADQIVELFQYGRGKIRSVSWAPNGELFAAHTDIGVYVFDAHLQKEVAFLNVGEVYKVDFSQTGDDLLVSHSGSYTSIWDTTTWIARVDNLDSHEFAVSPSENIVIHDDSDHSSLQISRIENGIVSTLGVISNIDNPSNLTFSLSGKYLAAVSESNTLLVWQVATGKLKLELDNFSQFIREVAFLSDEAIVVSMSGDHNIDGVKPEVSVWSIDSGNLLGIYSGHSLWLYPSPITNEFILKTDHFTLEDVGEDGSYSGTSEYEILKVVLDNGELIKSTWGGDEYISHLVFTPDGENVVTLSQDGNNLVTSENASKILSFEGDYLIENYFFSPDGKYLIGIDYSGNLIVWDVETGSLLEEKTGFISFPKIKISSDSTEIFMYASEPLFPNQMTTHEINIDNGTISQYNSENIEQDDLENNHQLPYPLSIDRNYLIDSTTGKILHNFFADTRSIHFAPNIRYIITVDGDGVVRFWGVSDSQENVKINSELIIPNESWIRLFDLSIDGSLLASIDSENYIHIWDMNQLELLQSIKIPIIEEYPKYQDIAISDNRNFVAVVRNAETSYVWDIDGRELVPIDENAMSAEFIDSDNYLVTGSESGHLRTWDTSNWELVNEISLANNNTWLYSIKGDDSRRWLLVAQYNPNRILVYEASDTELSLFYEKTFDTPLFDDVVLSQTGMIIYNEIDVNSSTWKSNDYVRIWDVIKDNEIESFYVGSSDFPYDVNISPNLKWMIVQGEKQKLDLWDVEKGLIVDTFFGYGSCLLSNTYITCEGDNGLEVIWLSD
jgi:WD40 repeat protein